MLPICQQLHCSACRHVWRRCSQPCLCVFLPLIPSVSHCWMLCLNKRLENLSEFVWHALQKCLYFWMFSRWGAGFARTPWLDLCSLKLSAAITLPTWVQVLMNSTLANPHSKASDSFLVEILSLDTMWWILIVSALLWRDLERSVRWGALINNVSGLITPGGLCNCCTVSLFNSISHTTASTSPHRAPLFLPLSLFLALYKHWLSVSYATGAGSSSHSHIWKETWVQNIHSGQFGVVIAFSELAWKYNRK